MAGRVEMWRSLLYCYFALENQEQVEVEIPIQGGQPGTEPVKPVSERLEQIAHSWLHRFKLDTWQKDEQHFASQLDRKETERASMQNKIYRLLGIYFLFQGLIFGVIAQSEKLGHADRWFPFSLSLVTSIVVIIAVWQKLRIASDLEKEIAENEFAANAIYESMANLMREGTKFNVDTDEHTLEKEPASISFYAYAVTFFLLLFSIVSLVSVDRMISNK